MHWSSTCLVRIQDHACVFFCHYTYISGLPMPMLVTHNIHCPTCPTACVIGPRYFIYLLQNTNLLPALTIVPCNILPACLSVGASRLRNASSFCCRFTVLVHMWSVIYFNFISCHRVGTTRTDNTSKPSVCSILSICARVQPYLSYLCMPPLLSGYLPAVYRWGGGCNRRPSEGEKEGFGGKIFF